MSRRRRGVDAVVEAILEGAPVPRADLAPADADVIRAAIDLRTARPGADAPSEDFLTRLRREVNDTVSGGDVPVERRWSRRSLLAGAAAAVAGAGAAGAVLDHALNDPSPALPTAAAPGESVVPNDGEWVQVASAADLESGGPHRFSTANAVGFVTSHDGALTAVSGVCTHVGCFLKANAPAGRLDCPCHRTSFGTDGQVLFSQLSRHPAPLPTYSVRSRPDGGVEVFVPTDT
jgi:nitrite reductase/ring-hydroxylating ferredoxin subunit